MRPAVLCALWGLWALLLPAVLGAQQVEARVDAIWTGRPAWFGGLGLTWSAGNYARLSAIGAHTLGFDNRGRTLRGDLIARVTLDPFRRRRVGLSFGGGITVMDRTWLVALLDLEGPKWKRVIPALQLGVGGGYRAGLVLRAARGDRR